MNNKDDEIVKSISNISKYWKYRSSFESQDFP